MAGNGSSHAILRQCPDGILYLGNEADPPDAVLGRGLKRVRSFAVDDDPRIEAQPLFAGNTFVEYDYRDQDRGSAGPVLPPGTDLLLAGGKDGILYVFDRHNLGKKIADLSFGVAPIDGDANYDVVEGIARAYDAVSLDPNPIDPQTPRLKLLWDSKRTGVTYNHAKFCAPVVADGRLFVPTYDRRVDMYMLG